jgi:glucose-6-phosphate 1-dehydrogenase
MQVVALLAMEPPASGRADAIRDEKVKVLKGIQALDPGRLVRGQFGGYATRRAWPGTRIPRPTRR